MMMMTRLLFTRYIDDGDNDGDDYDVYLCMFTVVFESTFDRHIDDDDALMMMRQPRTDPLQCLYNERGCSLANKVEQHH